MNRSEPEHPAPDRIIETLSAYQRSEALRAAIELELFTAVGEGASTAAELAGRCGLSERGVRMLCDYLVVLELIEKRGGAYANTPETSRYLDRRSVDYLGGSARFLASPTLKRCFAELPAAVRRGGTAVDGGGTITPDHEVWIDFARGMAPLMAPTAEALAELLEVERAESCRVLDLAAGHGLFGIAIGRRNSRAELVALDWPRVLDVARENARSAGLAERYTTIAGSALELDFGKGYDLVLLANLLHHFDRTTCVDLLRKVHGSLADSGRAVTVEYVPHEDRVSPPRPATFALIMLATTPAGDAYTFSELDAMFAEAGFSGSRLSELAGSLHQVVISHK